MPLDLHSDASEEYSVEELTDWLCTEQVDTSNVEDFARAAPALKRLSNNRRFLADMAIEEMTRSYSADEAIYLYTAQVMMLFRPERRQDNFLLRANIWPAESDPVVRAAGTGAFFYHRPHDHNFNFLTVGYAGPGYGSNYYEYDAQALVGYPGERVDSLVYKKTKTLQEGEIMLYRAGVDVHDQLPPESLSVSVNIVENAARSRVINQYAFDLAKSRITRIINVTATPALFSAALLLGGETGKGVLEDMATSAASPMTRLTARRALAGRSTDAESWKESMAKALDDRDRMVREWARNQLDGVRSGAQDKAD